MTPVDIEGASNLDLVDEVSPNIGEGLSPNVVEGLLSRADSIYYTPDATTDKLEQLTL